MTKHYTDLELMNWRPAKNVGGSTIGSREVCQVVTGGDGLSRSIVAVQQPSSTAGKSYCVNGPMPIPAGKFGRVCFGPVVLVAYDTGSPAVDDQFGWKASQGTVSTGSNPLFSVMRVVDSTNKLLLGVVTGGTSLIPIELKGDLSGTSSTTAYRLKDDGSGNEEADLTGDTIDVYNQPHGRQFRALGRDTMGSTAGGARGWVQMSSITGRYEVVQIAEENKAKRCKGTLSQAIAFGDYSCTVNNVLPGNGTSLTRIAPPTLRSEMSTVTKVGMASGVALTCME